MKVRFGEFVLDSGARALAKAGEAVHLTPKAYELLEFLLERRPRALSKGQLHDHLWPSTFVSHVNLPALATELRKVLGDDARTPRFVRTVRGFGYAFCGAATEQGDENAGPEAERVENRIVWEGREVSLETGDNLLGRTREARVWVEHASVSRRHAVIRVSEAEAVLEDCGSRNGTWAGARRIEGPTPLHDGDRIRLGAVELIFRTYRGQRTTQVTRKS